MAYGTAFQIRRKVVGGRCEELESRVLLSGVPISPAVTHPLTVPPLFSDPGSPHTLYLNFLGDNVPNWLEITNPNGSPGYKYQPGVIPAYDTDGDASTFSDAELANINLIFQTVAEKFSPFDLNVTTVNPGNRNAGQAAQVDIGGTNSWLGFGGGISAIGSFASATATSLDRLAFVFDTPNPFSVADGIAHEAGHMFGLAHQARVDAQNNVTQEYSDGGDYTGNGVPIMGAANLNPLERGLWWNGPTSTRDNNNNVVYNGLQDDLPVLDRTLGIVPRPGYTVDDAIPLAGGLGGYTGSGVMRFPGDLEWFSFTASGGTEGFNVRPNITAPMLTPVAAIYNGNLGNLIASSTGDLTEATVTTNALIAGRTYYLVVGQVGATGTTNAYFQLGQFTLSSIPSTLSVLGADGTLHIYGSQAQDNNLTITVDPDNVTVSDTYGGSTFVKQYSVFDVITISAEMGSGNDSITVVTPITVANPLPAVRIDGGGGGNNTLTIDTTNAPHAMTLNATQLTGLSNQPFTFSSIFRVILNCGSGNDSITYGGGDLMSCPRLTFNGGGGANTVTVDNTQNPDPWGYGMDNLSFFAADLNVYYNRFDPMSNVQSLTVDAGNNNDTFSPESDNPAFSFTINGNGGNDTLFLGDPSDESLLSQEVSPIVFHDGFGGGSIVVNDTASATPQTYNISLHQLTSGSSAPVTFDDNLASLLINGPSGQPGTFNVSYYSTATSLTLVGGAANDVFVFNNTDYRNSTVIGGGGTNTLVVDDRPLLGGGYASGFDLYPDKVVRHIGGGGGVADVIHYTGIQSAAYYALASPVPNPTFTVNVYGTSSDIGSGYQWSVFCDHEDDTVIVHPHDAAGNLTINGNIGISGGAGNNSFIIDDSGSSGPIHYTFSNPFGAGTADISGMGSASLGIASNFGTITIKAGDGNDTFDINSFESGNALAIFGNGGDDTVNFTPASHYLSAYLTSIFAFTFDGGAGYNRLNLFNQNDPSAWQYIRTNGYLRASKLNYFVVLNDPNVQFVSVDGGSHPDQILATAIQAGTETDFVGGGGTDVLTVQPPSAIAGLVSFDGGTGTSSIIVNAQNATNGVIAHVDDSTVGAFPGDTLFAPGGSLRFSNTHVLTVNTGAGANVIDARPSGTMLVFNLGVAGTAVRAADTTGATLNLAVADATDPTLASGAAGAGTYTFGNAQPISFTGVSHVNLDDIAPAVTGSGFHFDAAPQSVTFSFTKDVSPLLDVSRFDVTNVGTGQPIPASDMAVAYDPSSNVATLTFPGFANGILPNGNYRATLLAGLSDTVGNRIDSDATLDFFALAGDINRDRTVDFSDLLTLAQHYGQSGATFADGDLDGDGTVGFGDLLLLAQNYGATLPSPAVSPAGGDLTALQARTKIKPGLRTIARDRQQRQGGV